MAIRISRKEFVTLVARGASGCAAVTAIGAVGCAGPNTSATVEASASSKKQSGGALKGATEALVKFITSATLDAFPADVVAQGKRCLVDGVGVMLAGSTTPGSGIVRDYVKAVAGKKEASVVGPERLSATAAQAALANGAAGHAMDFDDTQLSTTADRTYGLLTHPTVPVLAASLAIAERQGASGRTFLEAFLTGFEVECKIAEAIDPSHYQRGFHTSGTVGVFGAAACAAKLMKLDAEAVSHTLTIASSLAAGIRVNFGSMTKLLHVGRAAENGIVAAELGSRGFTGGADGLDGQWGFFQVFGGGAELERLIPVLGRPYTIVKPGVSIKPYPSGVLSHPSMDAMLTLVTVNDIKPDQVAAVRLRAGSNILEPLRYKVAKTELEAKFSVPFLLSSIVLRRKAGIREFTDAFVTSAPVQQMMARVTTVFDPQIEAQGFDKIRSVVEVDLTDGRKFTQASDDRYRGGPDRPLTREELHDRFTDCATIVLAAEPAARALAQIEGVDQLKDIRDLAHTLTSLA